MKEAIKLVANNKKAYHDYFIDEKFECGIELFGTEVKSIRMGKCSVKEAFVRIDKNASFPDNFGKGRNTRDNRWFPIHQGFKRGYAKAFIKADIYICLAFFI